MSFRPGSLVMKSNAIPSALPAIAPPAFSPSHFAMSNGLMSAAAADPAGAELASAGVPQTEFAVSAAAFALEAGAA